MSVHPSRPARAKVTADMAVRLAAISAGVMLLTLAFAAPSSAKRIYKSIPTHLTLSATRAADGTITAKAVFTSPNPRCLSAKRWKKNRDGYYHEAGGGLLYGGPGIFGPVGGDGNGSPPDNGWLFPVSTAGHSPYVWEAVWPGAAEVAVDKVEGSGDHWYKSTVAAASGVGLGGEAPASHLGPYFKYPYNQGGNRIILQCHKVKTAFQLFVF